MTVVLAGMAAQDRERDGSTFTVEVTTGAVPANVDPETGWTDRDKPVPASTVTTATTTHKGTIYPALENPELARAEPGVVERDDQLLHYAPALDLSETSTRKVAVVWQGRRYHPQDLDPLVMADQVIYRRALLKLREGAGATGA